MSTMPQISVALHDQYGQPLDDVTIRGLAIYEERLKEILEPEHTGEVVAIHIDSGDHTVADSSPEALRAMRRQHPSGLLFLYTIGPATDYGLARRMAGLGTGARRK
ncbi:MAG: hypothetical protein M3Y13_15275 [Armatimonadota bacterium]|nr:hypothetical protein [Armatimonadota bacterium]